MILSRLFLVLVVAVGLSGCDSQREDTADPVPDEVTSTDSPMEEGTGAETPLPPDEEMAVNLPELPVGGNSTGEAEDQCAAPALADVPDGVSVRVTAIRFSEDGVFETRGSGCDDLPACAGFTFTSERSVCGVRVVAVGTTEEEVLLYLDGKCVAEDLRDCDELDGHGSVPLITPTPPETSTEDTETTEEPTEEPTDEPTPSPTE